jgi:hypothetical protein
MAASTKPVHVNVNLELFDRRPMEMPGFRFRARCAEPVGRPTLEQWTTAIELAEALERSAPDWVGDLLLYADTRPDWAERASQALAQTRLAKGTLDNLKSISRRVGAAARALAPSKSHAAEVAALPAPDQEWWLRRATEENWTERELRRALRDAQRSTVLDGMAATMFEVEVTVMVNVEAANPTRAQDRAWDAVKHALEGERQMKVIEARARPR